jgi:hypothetical protein
MHMDIPECKLTDVSLVPIDEKLRGFRGPRPSDLKGWLQIGEPLVRELDAKTLGKSPLTQFVRESKDYRFLLLHFACSFRPMDGESFAEAWFKVRLSATLDKAIAWSMTPERLTDEYKLTNSVTLGAGLKLQPVTVKAETSAEREATVAEVYIEALNLLASDPVWELRRTRSRELRGLHQVQLVARLHREARGRAELSLSASVERKMMGIIPYAAAFEDTATNAIDLP